MSHTAKVSVVMSVYNSASTLEKTMDSILTQEGIDMELIVVNDGSTDGSGAVLDDYSAQDRRLRVIHQNNRGLTRSLIKGCAEATGEYLARQDAGGDASLPTRLNVQASFLDANPEAVMTSCGTRFIGPAGEVLYDISQAGEELQRGLQSLTLNGLRGPSSHGSTMFRASAYRKVGGYRAEFPVAQDLDLWIRLSEVGKCLATPDVLYQLILAKGSISHLRRFEQIERTKVIFACAQRRRVGADETGVLRQMTSSRRPLLLPNQGLAEARFHYFIASVLRKKNPTRAARYYMEAIRSWTLYPKAWVGLGMCAVAKLVQARNPE